jgi:hypothetical protein
MVEAADTQGQCLLARYAELQNALLTRVKSDRFTELSGRLLGALTELPSFLELGTNDTGNALDARGNPVYEIRYSANCGDLGGTLVAAVPLLPATVVLPKERWMLEQVRGQLARGRNVLIFLRHTGNLRLVTRYQRLLRQELGVDAGYLNSSKVLTGVREAWIRREVLARRQRVLLVNPESIKTGLNCLAPYFKTAIWMELTYNVLTMRQANGRIHRIGADPAHPIEILVPVYAGTAQEVALELIARKLSVSMQMDGLDVESQLEAAGAGDADSTGIQQLALMNMGQAIFDILEGHAARSPVNAVPMTVATPALPDGRNGALFSTVEPELASPPVPLSTRPRPSMVARTLPAGSLVGSHPVAIQQYKQAALVDALPMHLPAIPSANSPAEPQPMVAEQGHATPLGSAHPTRVGDGHRYRQSTLFDGMPAT